MIKLQYKQYHIAITEKTVTISLYYERPLSFMYTDEVDIIGLVERANRIWDEEIWKENQYEVIDI